MINTRQANRILASAAGIALAAVLLTGCGDKVSEPFKDAPRSHNDNGAPADPTCR